MGHINHTIGYRFIVGSSIGGIHSVAFDRFAERRESGILMVE
jgi:hypothetical protein